MAPKKKTTKKTVKKQAVKQEAPKLDLTRPFDLAGASAKQLEEYAVFVEQLKVSAGWQILKQTMEDNLKVIAKQIVEKVGLNGEVLSDEDVDLLRVQHRQIEQLVGLPDMIISKFKPESGGSFVQYDPYSGEGIQASVLSMSDTT